MAPKKPRSFLCEAHEPDQIRTIGITSAIIDAAFPILDIGSIASTRRFNHLAAKRLDT